MDLIKERLTFPEARLCRLVTEDRIWSEAAVPGVLTDGGSSALNLRHSMAAAPIP